MNIKLPSSGVTVSVTTIHNDTLERDAADCHPASAITGLTVIDNLTDIPTRNHNDLQNRDAADCHPASAITGLTVIDNLTDIPTRNHNDLQNRDALLAHPPEAVGVLSQISQKLLIATQQTVSAFRKRTIQHQVSGSTIYYVWAERDGTFFFQIWTATSNLDGTGFVPTQQTVSAFDKYNPQLQVSGSTIYYVWEESDGALRQIWTATSNLDGTGFIPTQQTVSAFNKYNPQLQVSGSTIYYVWEYSDGAFSQIWTATSNLDGTGFIPTQQTVSAFGKYKPQLQVAGSTIYYVWEESDGTFNQIWTATSNLDGTGFIPTQQTVSADSKYEPQLQVAGSTIYYVWNETSVTGNQIWTATSNLDGTGFIPTQQTVSAFNKYDPQLQVAGSTIYYVWWEYDGTFFSQIWTATSNLDGTGFVPTQQTVSAFDKYNPQLQAAGSTIYYVWEEYDGAFGQIRTATSPLVYISSYFPRRRVDVTAFRALDTTYTNTDQSRTLHIQATVRCTITAIAGNAYAQGKAEFSAGDPTAIASGIVGIEAGAIIEDISVEINFYVMSGEKYRIDSNISVGTGTVTLGNWFETYI